MDDALSVSVTWLAVFFALKKTINTNFVSFFKILN